MLLHTFKKVKCITAAVTAHTLVCMSSDYSSPHSFISKKRTRGNCGTTDVGAAAPVSWDRPRIASGMLRGEGCLVPLSLVLAGQKNNFFLTARLKHVPQ